MTYFNFGHAGFCETSVFLAEAALAAGSAVMEIYERGCKVETKRDGSPVTAADRRAEEIICGFLRNGAATPPIIAEESTQKEFLSSAVERFILVDPLDGTREFLARNGDFTINVALIENGAPVAGAVYAPALGRLWFGGGESFVCDVRPGETIPERIRWRTINTRRAPLDALMAVASRSHGDQRTETFLRQLPSVEIRSRGSSLKFCLVAEGLADVYPRFGPTMEWDTAAGDAVLRSAGGVVLDESGVPLVYGKVDCGLKNSVFIAWGDPESPKRLGLVNRS